MSSDEITTRGAPLPRRVRTLSEGRLRKTVTGPRARADLKPVDLGPRVGPSDLSMEVRMKTSASLCDPGSVQVSITLTMDLDDWERLRDQLDASKAQAFSSYPASHLRITIAQAVRRIRSKVELDEPEESL